jgi:hypothetical protein
MHQHAQAHDRIELAICKRERVCVAFGKLD